MRLRSSGSPKFGALFTTTFQKKSHKSIWKISQLNLDGGPVVPKVLLQCPIVWDGVGIFDQQIDGLKTFAQLGAAINGEQHVDAEPDDGQPADERLHQDWGKPGTNI